MTLPIFYVDEEVRKAGPVMHLQDQRRCLDLRHAASTTDLNQDDQWQSQHLPMSYRFWVGFGIIAIGRGGSIEEGARLFQWTLQRFLHSSSLLPLPAITSCATSLRPRFEHSIYSLRDIVLLKVSSPGLGSYSLTCQNGTMRAEGSLLELSLTS